MTSRILAGAFGAAAFVLVGCGTYDVSVCRNDGKPCTKADFTQSFGNVNYQDVPGVPFTSRVPERAHYSKWLVQQDIITVTATVTDEKKKVVDVLTTPPPLLVYPHQDDADAQLSMIAAIVEAHKDGVPVFNTKGASGKTDSQELLDGILKELRPHFNALKKHAVGIPATGQLAGNDIETQAVLDDGTYYLDFKRPLMGTVSGTVKLGADGTLSEADGNITDNTISTVLSTAEAIATGGASAAATAAGDAVANPPTGSHANRLVLQKDIVGCIPKVTAAHCPTTHKTTPPKKKYTLTLVIKIEQGLQMVVLKRLCAHDMCDADVKTLLTLCDARHDNDSGAGPCPAIHAPCRDNPEADCPIGDTRQPVQIVSITPYPPPTPPASDKKSKKDDKDDKGDAK